MLFNFLASSYLQYKADTDTVAKWLVGTAILCGYPIDTLWGDTPTPQPSKRLEGKARKLARKAVLSTQSGSPQGLKHILNIKDFVSLAEHIAASTGRKVKVPVSFVTILDRAISMRQRHGARVTKGDLVGPEIDDSSDRHQHFIGILEHVRKVLQPLMSSDEVKDRSARRSENTSVDLELSNLANRFEVLDVHEPSQSFLQAPDITISMTSDNKSRVDYEIEKLHDIEEAYIALGLLIQDLKQMQDLIRRTWQGYRNGLFDLVSVSLMTNTAIDFARHMEQEIEQVVSPHGGCVNVMLQIYHQDCEQHGKDPSFREQPGDSINLETYEIAEPLFFTTYTLLSGLNSFIKPDSVLGYTSGASGAFDRTSDRSKKSPRDKFSEDRELIREAVSECLFLHRCQPKAAPCEDGVTQGLRSMFDTQEIPFWLVFACQVFLDIHHCLGRDFERGFNDLTTSVRQIEQSINMNLRSHANFRIDTWPQDRDKVLHDLLAKITFWIASDFTQQSKEQMRIWVPADKFKFLKGHPLLCGMVTYYFKAQFQDIAIAYSGAWGSIVSSAHVYNALRQEKLLSSNRWSDMDAVLRWHGEIFVGDPPRRGADYFRRYCLSLGYSPSHFSPTKRKKPRFLTVSTAGPRRIQKAAPISRVFFSRYCEETKQVGLSESDVKKIFANVAGERDKGDGKRTVLSMQRSNTKQKKPTVDKSIHQLAFVPLLETLRDNAYKEGPEFAFDYMRLHQACWAMLGRLKDACEPHLQKVARFEDGTTTLLPFIAGYVFILLDDTRKRDPVVVAQVIKNAVKEIEDEMLSQSISLSLQFLGKQGFHTDLEGEE